MTARFPVLIIVCATVFSCASVRAQNDLVVPQSGPIAVELMDTVPLPAGGMDEVLFDHAFFVNSVGTGTGGADESVLQTVSLGMNTLGFENSVGRGWRVADDFTPGGSDMHVLRYVVYAYQEGAGPGNPTFDEFNLCVWLGQPGNGGVPYWGDCATNHMTSATDIGVLRVTEQTSGMNDERAIYAIDAAFASYMEHYTGTATFWLDWQVGGTLASGPFTPPVTLTGACETGNGIQSFDGGVTWEPAIDAATGCRQGFPFQLRGYFYIPVELVAFEGIVNGTSVNLHWETASETNNAGFEVQIDRGTGFEAVSFVDGHGTTTEAQTYGHTVTDLAPGTYAFRLKQIDFDGAFEYSDEVEATIEVVGTHVLTDAYPNPFNPQATFTFAASQAQTVTAVLYNALGQRVAVLFDGSVEADQTQTVSINGAGLSSGLYVVRVEGERFSDALRVTLLK